MRYKVTLLLALAVAAILTATGCASTKQILPPVAEENAPSTKALVIAERPSTTGGWARGIKVYDNGTLVGSLGPGGRLAWVRDPGPMDILFEGATGYNGRSVTVGEGETYHCTLNCKLSTGFTVEGQGLPVSDETKRHSPTDSLVFFRVLPNEEVGELTLVSIQTGRLVRLAVNPKAKLSPWHALYLPPGEYNFADWTVHSTGVAFDTTAEYEINAEFAITTPNAAVYVGDIVISGSKISIRGDSSAAREFLQQSFTGLPYTESKILFNK